MGSETPVIIEAPSLRRKTIGAAISSSVAHRPSGIWHQERLADVGAAPVEGRHLGHHDGGVHAVHADAVAAELERRDTRVMLSSAAFDAP